MNKKLVGLDVENHTELKLRSVQLGYNMNETVRYLLKVEMMVLRQKAKSNGKQVSDIIMGDHLTKHMADHNLA